MKKLFFVLSALMLMSLSSIASAQVIILEETPGDNCRMMLSGPCAPAPEPAPMVMRPRVVRPRYAPPPVVNEPTVPPPPAGLPRAAAAEWMPQWSVHFIYLSTGDQDGSLLGGGLSAEYMFSRHFGLEGSILGMGSGQEDMYAPYRDGMRAGLSLLWFPSGMKAEGISFYMRGGVVAETISTYEDAYGYEPIASRDTSYREVAAGLRYYIPLIRNYYAMSLGIEASILFDSHSSDSEDGEDRSTAAARLTFGFHF